MPAVLRIPPLKTIAIIIVSVLVADSAVLLLLQYAGLGEYLPVWGAPFVNAILLPLVLLPVCFHFIYRPFGLQLMALQSAEATARDCNRRLHDDLSLRQDITVELTRLIRQQEMILSAAKEAIIGVDCDGRIMFVNDAAERFLGWSREELIGTEHHELFQHSYPSGSPYPKTRCPIHFTLTTGQGFEQIEEFFWRRDGRGCPVEISCAPLQEDSHPIGAVVTFRDISERKEAEEKIRNLAYFDPLTGLPNRLLLQDRFSQILAQCKREEKSLALMYLDLDNFKMINDTFGHAVGDAYLNERAEKIRSCVRANDTVARMGGDEFVWTGKLVKPEEGAVVAEKILTALAEPVNIDGHTITSTVSIGIALYPQDGTALEELIKAADAAMYEAKAAGKSAFRHVAGSPSDILTAPAASPSAA